MKPIRKPMNLWTAALVVLVASMVTLYCATHILNTKSLVSALFAALAIGVTIFFALWALFGSLRPNQGKDEFNQMNLRLKEMAGGDEVPTTGDLGRK